MGYWIYDVIDLISANSTHCRVLLLRELPVALVYLVFVRVY